MRKLDGVERVNGGERIARQIMYEDNATVNSYSGYEVIRVDPQDGITQCFYDWREIGGSITISRREERQNSGEAAIMDLMKQKTMQAEMSIKEKVINDLILGTVNTATFVPGNSAKDLNPLGYFFRAAKATDPLSEVELEVQNREGVLARLKERLNDMCIMSAPPQDPGLQAEPFLDNPLVVIAPRAYRAPAHPTLKDLAKERFLLREPGSGTRMAIDEHLGRERVVLAHRMTVGSNEAIKHAVAGGLGLAILSRRSLSEDDLAELKVLEVRGFPIERSWFVVGWRDQHVSATAEAFHRHLLEFASGLRGAPVIPAGRASTRARARTA